MRHATWIATCLIALVAGAACGDDAGSVGPTGGSGGSGGSGGAGATDGGNSDSGGSGATDKACTEMANALCGRLSTCSAAFLSLAFVDMTTCVGVAKGSCLASLQAKQTGATPDALSKCSEDLKSASCPDVLSHNPPVSCRPSGGTVGNGMVCGDDWQCQSGRCAVPADANCGVCAARAAAGAACPRDTDDDCDFGLVCNNGTCIARSGSGAACDKNRPCANPYVCSAETGGVCTTGGQAGSPCTADNTCDTFQALWCPLTTRVCTAFQFVGAGMACGLTSAANYAVCKGGGCNPTPGAGMGTCARLAAPGETCSGTAPCQPGAKCINGLCAVRDPAACR